MRHETQIPGLRWLMPLVFVAVLLLFLGFQNPWALVPVSSITQHTLRGTDVGMAGIQDIISRYDRLDPGISETLLFPAIVFGSAGFFLFLGSGMLMDALEHHSTLLSLLFCLHAKDGKK